MCFGAVLSRFGVFTGERVSQSVLLWLIGQLNVNRAYTFQENVKTQDFFQNSPVCFGFLCVDFRLSALLLRLSFPSKRIFLLRTASVRSGNVR